MTAGDAPTRISVDLATLSSEEPTLAGLAYLSKVRTTQPPNPGQNPATWSCATDLGGASSFGNAAAGGSWVDAKQPIFVVMNMCSPTGPPSTRSASGTTPMGSSAAPTWHPSCATNWRPPARRLRPAPDWRLRRLPRHRPMD